MKTKEELNEIKKEIETLNEKLDELTEEELVQVTGGATGGLNPFNREKGFGFIESQTYRRDSDKNPGFVMSDSNGGQHQR